MRPVVLDPNTFYGKWRGAGRIGAFRGIHDFDPSLAEDWVGSTVSRASAPGQGMSRLPDGSLLRDAIEANPSAWLGSERVEKHGTDVGILVKLLDAGERLPLHVHPSREFMRAERGTAHGKSEAWVVLTAEPGSEIAVGFSQEVSINDLNTWVEQQNTAALLAATTKIPVVAGDVIFCPAGLPHAIGSGIFLIEVEEPADLSIMLEWAGYAVDGPRDGHLGMGFAKALESVDRSAWDRERLEGLAVKRSAVQETRRGVKSLLNAAADPFFQVEEIRSGGLLDEAFSVLVVTEGSGILRMAESEPLKVHRGQTIVIPHGAGEGILEGDAEAIRLLAPRA